MRFRWLPALMALSILLDLVSPKAFALLLHRSYKASELVDQASIICTASVLSTQAQWQEDIRGRHIYTRVRLGVGQWIKGRAQGPILDLDIVGGTVGDITETVSDAPVLFRGEQALLFLKGSPLQVVGGIEGHIPIFNNQVFWNGRRVLVGTFATSLGLGQASDSVEPNEGPPPAEIQAGPKITGIVPDIASAGTSTEVTILGGGFGLHQDSGKVEFFYRAGKPRIEAPILSWSDTQIVCLVPVGDVADYAASASSGPMTVAVNSERSNEFPFRVTFGYDRTKWLNGRGVIPYYINENTADCADGGAAVQFAASRWNQTGASFRFTYSGSHLNTTSTNNRRNEVLWGRTPSGIAVTYSWTSHNGLEECDIVLNDVEYTWSTSDTPLAKDMDVQTVALHEFGHWLNLRDIYGDIGDREYDMTKVMYGFGSRGQLKRDLHPDDVAGIHHIYPPAATPATPASIDYPSANEDGRYKITWPPCTQASSYQLERSGDGGLKWIQIYDGPHVSLTESLGPGVYRYRTRALNIAGPSDWQNGDWDCIVLVTAAR